MPGRGRPTRSRDSTQERARKAFARRQRSRRWLTWRKVLAMVAGVALIGLGIYALYFSSWLRAEGVEVTGTDLLTKEQVLKAADVPTGGPLVNVDLAAIEKRLNIKLGAVKEVDVSRKWPHDVQITVIERTPVAVLDPASANRVIDSEGKQFRVPARGRKGLPRVTVGSGANSDALKEGAAVVTALHPEVAALVGYVEVRTVDEILLHLRDGRQVRWGSADQSKDKAAVLLELLNQKAKTYDVSVPGAPTTS